MNAAVEGYLEASEAEQETPIGHRIAKAGLATVAAVIVSWGIERAYDKFVTGSDEEEPEDEASDTQE